MARIRINRPRENDTGNPLIDNPDLATLENDARLSDIEARLNRLYGDAAKGVTEQLDSFLERFAERDEEMADRVARGEITQDEYIRWRQGQILRTRQMEQQIESLTNDMVNADQLAMQMVNGELPDVYVSSYNYTGFRGETLADAAGYSYNSFTLYNADAIRIIAAEDPDLIPWQPPEVDIPRDMRWNRQHIQNAIAHGILTGASINEISDSLMPIVNMDRNAATRTARTAFTAVQNQARRDGCARLRENGIPMVEPWMSVLRDNTRDTHLQLHGTYPNADGLYGEGIIGSGHLLRFPGDPNGDPEQIYNCQCSVQSYIAGLDHSRDRELYADMMRRDHYDDWVGQRDGYQINGVQDYRVDEQRRALERRRALNAGEIENRENRYRRRLQERQGGSVAPQAAPVASRRATTRDEAMQLLRDAGFNGNIPNAVKNIPDELFINIANRVDELQQTFHAVPDGADIVLKHSGGMAAFGNEHASALGTNHMTLNTKWYYNPESIRQQGVHDREMHWCMPFSDDYLDTYVITHEYGHALQYAIEDEMLSHRLDAPLSYRNNLRRDMRQQIGYIARQNHPDIDISALTSEYGRGKDQEFFAEVFANAMCGNPNELGEAMLIWLRRRGYNV